MSLEIHTTDRTRFKSCRLAWHFTSNLRRNLEPKSTGKAFAFGTAWHEALASYYDPQHPKRDIDRGKAVFKTSLGRWFDKIENPSPEDEDIYNESFGLGLGMLNHYGEYAAKYDKFTVLWVERHFLIPVPGMDAITCSQCQGQGSSDDAPIGYTCKTCDGRGVLPVVYSLKPDMVVQDTQNRVWVVEHKTADKMPGDNTEYLLMDDQVGSYLWGIEEVTGIRAEGCLYNIAWKRIPTPLTKLKDGTLSVDKRVVTTYDYAMKQIISHHTGEAVPIKYKDYLDELATQDNRFFYRENVRRNRREIELLEQHARYEIEEMLDPNLRIYRNPNRFNCSTCAFVGPCLAWYEGADYETMLRGNYQEKTR